MKIEGMDTLNDVFEYACKGNQHAVKLCRDIWSIAHFWDDLIDGDEVTKDEINQTMQAAYSGLLSNPFATLYAGSISGLLGLIIANWHTANSYEEKAEDLEKAYMLRAQMYNFPVLCAFLIGGQDWANHVSEISWAAYGETLDDIKKEFEHA